MVYENVLIYRENNGKVEFERINLNSSDVFKSPYFYLQQNDVVYVEPSKAKATSIAKHSFISIEFINIIGCNYHDIIPV